MKILAFAASNSRNSVNRKLATHAAELARARGAEIEMIDLNDYEMPIYSIDRELEGGIPSAAHDFLAEIGEADALIISFAEHNGNYSAAFKNIFDWASRVRMDVYQGKDMLLLATSPGAGGGQHVLNIAGSASPHFGGKVLGTLGIPSFGENFDEAKGELTNAELSTKLNNLIGTLDIDGASAEQMRAQA